MVLTLRRGDTGSAVVELQTLLMDAGHLTRIDGDYGPATEGSVRAYQKKSGLIVDGIAGPRTLAFLKGKHDPRFLKQSDLIQAAKRLGVDLASMHAVAEVETRDEGFLSDDRPKILFERHIFARRLKYAGLDIAQLTVAHPDLVNSQPGGYQGGSREHDRLQRAMGINRVCAIESASWGRFQIMGFHWQRLGYHSATGWKAAMETSEALHLEAFVRFVQSDRRLLTALRQKDWASFARTYNGPGYQKNRYDEKLHEAWIRFSNQIRMELAA